MIPREYHIPITLLALGSALWVTSLYQLEIVYIGLTSGWNHFDMPFYLFSLSFPVARDLWYLVNGISLLLVVIGGAVFNGKRMELKLRARD
jgi:hypothetical protein